MKRSSPPCIRNWVGRGTSQTTFRRSRGCRPGSSEWQRTPTWRGGRINLPLTAQRILATLYQRAGEVVSYDELFDVVKSGRNRDNVRKHVSTIRDAFREVDPAFDGIENVPMRGFRWVAKPARKK